MPTTALGLVVSMFHILVGHLLGGQNGRTIRIMDIRVGDIDERKRASDRHLWIICATVSIKDIDSFRQARGLGMSFNVHTLILTKDIRP